MNDLLTTRQVQELLKVDRITVYRMLQDGRLKGVKIGQQWRFALQDVERMLGGKMTVDEHGPSSAGIFPTHCVQTIQDLFSDVTQISSVVIDMQGKQITQTSCPGRFFEMLLSTSYGQHASQTTWQNFARDAAEGGKFFTCHAGLHYVGAPIYDGDTLTGLFLAGQFYWQPPDSREEAERVRRLASTHNLPIEDLQVAAREIPVIDPANHAHTEQWPFSAARAINSILRERINFMDRLQQIASLTQIS